MDIKDNKINSSFLNFIDSGDFFRKPFKVLYIILGIFNIAIPVLIGYIAYEADFMSAPTKWKLLFVIIWLIIGAASWLGFLIWWNRKEHLEVYSPADDEFVATHIFSHFTQTMGEWLGSFIAIVGFGMTFVLLFFLKDEAPYFLNSLSFKTKLSYFDLLRYPLTGFMIVVIARFFAEQVRAITTIARNTKKD